jgi:hypothetical protein
MLTQICDCAKVIPFTGSVKCTSYNDSSTYTIDEWDSIRRELDWFWMSHEYLEILKDLMCYEHYRNNVARIAMEMEAIESVFAQ